MAKKLGYTWYPKDWGNSESVFELSLSERGLYRELIDLAMMNDNKTELKKDVWSRKFCVSLDELNAILEKLSKLNLIKIDKTILFIPSCESRLNMVRGGSKGGKSSKGSDKPLCKGCGKPIHKGECNQREREIESINECMTETQFIEYWKKCRMEYDKNITNIDKLEFHERQIFDRIKSEYTIERITDAVAGMFMQKNMFPALRLRPKHFLESFTKYLDCWDNNIQLFKDDKKDNFKQDKL